MYGMHELVGNVDLKVKLPRTHNRMNESARSHGYPNQHR